MRGLVETREERRREGREALLLGGGLHAAAPCSVLRRIHEILPVAGIREGQDLVLRRPELAVALGREQGLAAVVPVPRRLPAPRKAAASAGFEDQKTVMYVKECAKNA